MCASVCEQHRPTRLVVGMAERRNRLPVQDLLEVRFGGVLVEDAADTYEVALHRVCSSKIQPSQLIFSSMLGPRRNAIALQTFYSLMISLLGLVLTSPLLLLTALAVRLTSKGPVLYRQRRVGLNGRLFTVYKFRSMYVDAEARTGAVWAVKDDPRITPVGKWLRKLRLDELPQFWNVVRGRHVDSRATAGAPGICRVAGATDSLLSAKARGEAGHYWLGANQPQVWGQ